MTGVNISCQTFSWQMSLETYRGRIGHIASIAKQAGFSDIEPEIVLLGDLTSAEQIRDAVEPHGIRVPSLVIAEEWAAPKESDDERDRSDQAIALADGLGAKQIVVVQKSDGRHDLAARQRGLMNCFDAIAERAADHGIGLSFHPNSLDTSLFVDAADYDVLEQILPERVGFAPDLGHVARGGMDVVETIKRFRDRVVHLHVKDMFDNGDWAPTGEGIVDIVGVFRYLTETGFTGWAAFEDESALAETDPDEATLRAGRWVQDNLTPYRANA